MEQLNMNTSERRLHIIFILVNILWPQQMNKWLPWWQQPKHIQIHIFMTKSLLGQTVFIYLFLSLVEIHHHTGYECTPAVLNYFTLKCTKYPPNNKYKCMFLQQKYMLMVWNQCKLFLLSINSLTRITCIVHCTLVNLSLMFVKS